GYRTGLIGEWELGSQPWTQGFDEFTGFVNAQEAANYFSPFVWQYFPNGIEDAATGTKKYSFRQTLYGNEAGNHEHYLPDVFMQAAHSFVRIHQPGRGNHYRPFFLLVNLPAPRSATVGKDDFPVPTDAPFTDEPWPQAAKNRASLISRLDTSIGQLLEQLQQGGMTNNVAIFFSGAVAPRNFASTNLNFLKLPGEVCGGTDAAHLRAPMLVRWPGHVPAGQVNPQPWSAADFAAMALEIGFVNPPASSKLPLLLGNAAAPAPKPAPSKPDGPPEK
ncbi:MAG TPA: sulfatase-like hydrolase/transferase, partial [Verrucomicrobiae bacterium]